MKKRDDIKGERNVLLTDYIVLLLRSYGIIDDYPYIKEEQGEFREALPTLNDKEKEILKSYYLFYGKYYETNVMRVKDNATNAYCILQSFPKEVGMDLDNHYEFLKSRIIDRVESTELDEILEGLDHKEDDIALYYNNVTVNQVPIGKILLESGFNSIDLLGRLASACLFVNEHPEITGKEVLDYLYKIDHDDGYLNNIDFYWALT